MKQNINMNHYKYYQNGFWSIGGTNPPKILQLSVKDQYDVLSLELDHLAKTGLCVVVLDKNNRVAMISYGFDQCDKPSYNVEINDGMQRKIEILDTALQSDHMYQQLVATRKNEIKYGEIYYHDKTAIRPDLLKQGIWRMDFHYLIYAVMGYKYIYNMFSNPYTMKAGEISSTKHYH